jgi:hypothetical protein
MMRYSFLVRLSHPLLQPVYPGASLIPLSAPTDTLGGLDLFAYTAPGHEGIADPFSAPDFFFVLPFNNT